MTKFRSLRFHLSQKNLAVQLSAAIILPITAAVLRLSFLQVLGQGVTYVTFYPAVILAALYGGVYSGLLSTIISAVLATYFWIEPVGLAIYSAADMIGLILFSTSGILVSVITEMMHRALKRADKAEMQMALTAERERAEAAKRILAERLDIAQRAANIAIWDWNFNTNKMYWSPQLFNLFGLNPQSCQPSFDLWKSIIYPDDLNILQKRFYHLREEQATFNRLITERLEADYRVVLPDGTLRWLTSIGELIHDDQGWPIRMTGICIEITERKMTEKALEEAKDRAEYESSRLAVILEAGPSAIVLLDTSGRLIYINRRAHELYGIDYTGYEIDTHIKAINAFKPDGSPYMKSEMPAMRSLATGESVHNEEMVIQRFDGLRLPVLINSAPLYDAAGKITGAVLIFQDITQRKKAEDALRKTEERYRRLVQNTTAVIFQLDPHGIIRFANERALNFFGYQENELIGKNVIGTIVPAQESTGRYLATMVLEISKSPDHYHSNSNENICKDGRRVWMEWTNTGIYDEQGTLKEFLSVGIDVTARKHAEAELQKVSGQKQIALDAANLGWWHYDPISGTVGADKRVDKIFDLTDAEHNEQELLKHLEPEDLYVRENFKAALDPKNPKPYSAEYRIYHKDGSMHWIEAHGIADFEGEGENRHPTSFVGTVQDITERKSYMTQIQQALREKEILLKEIHHRVKNNMAVIIGLLDLHADSINKPEVAPLFKELRDRIRSMSMVHEKLYKTENLSQIDFADYAESLLGYIWKTNRTQCAVNLILELNPILLTIQKAIPMGLILNELASNALKHGFKGRTSGTVTCSFYTAENQNVCLKVSDDGVGLADNFDWKNSQTLGLRLVNMLASQIDAVAEVNTNQGTEFSICFPPEENHKK